MSREKVKPPHHHKCNNLLSLVGAIRNNREVVPRMQDEDELVAYNPALFQHSFSLLAVALSFFLVTLIFTTILLNTNIRNL